MKCYKYVLEPKQKVGVVSIEESCSLQSNVLDEDWSGVNPSYDPLVASQNKNIIRTAIGLTKSGKKKFKREERERICALENNMNNGNSSNSTGASHVTKSTNSEQPLRVPKKAAKAMLLSQNDCFSDLTTQLKHVSIEQNSSLKKTNVLTMSNSSHSSVDSLKTNTSSMLNILSNSKGISVEEQAKSDYKESRDTDTTCLDNLKVNKEVPKEKHVLAVNSLKKHDDNKGTAIKKAALLRPSNKQNCLESRNAINLNSKITEKLYGPAKKISTGRGFTIAYQYLNKSFAEAEERKENSGDLASVRGYDED